MILAKIVTAVEKGQDHVNILEKDIRTLFKFFSISSTRSMQYRDKIVDPRRENDFMFQQMFAAASADGKSSDPAEFWLDRLLYVSLAE